jgi:glycerol kinase
VEWLVELGLAADAAEVDRLARAAGSSRGVAFVPALQGLGTPAFDPSATGMIRGITPGTGAPEIARALLEGIAHRCVDLADALSLDESPLAVDGGLARSDVLLQALADFGGREIERAAETETTALGAAFLAGLATGVWDGPAACLSALREPAPFRPASAREEREALRERWRSAVERARGE